MEKKIVLTRGIPASWKSTWAKNEVATNWAVRFNKDDIRNGSILPWNNYVFTKENERKISDYERACVEEAMNKWEKYIIVDNTHLKKWNKHVRFYISLAEKYGYKFEIKDFYVSREEAILRDELRSNPVWVDVIDKMIEATWNWWVPPSQPLREDLKWYSKEKAVIFDIDGTLANMYDWRWPYEWNLAHKDKLNYHVYNVLNMYEGNDYKIIIVSWRSDKDKEITEKWLKSNWIYYTELYMREEWDNRNDAIVKKEIYEKYIENNYSVEAVYDDRNRVVDMWRLELNIPCFQVYYWDF